VVIAKLRALLFALNVIHASYKLIDTNPRKRKPQMRNSRTAASSSTKKRRAAYALQ